jgi:NitT/TauT family transport system permease protein
MKSIGTCPTFVARAALGLSPLVALLLLWQAGVSFNWLSPEFMPAPAQVARTLGAELGGSRLWHDIVVSLGRLAVGLIITVTLGAPLGLWLGQSRVARSVVLPSVNFLRSLSPLAWMPFVVIFSGVGSTSAVVLIVLACAPTMIVGAAQAALSIPRRHYDVAQLHRLSQWEAFTQITCRGSLNGLVATLRLTVAVAWIVLVAAEMISGQDGLGFAIMDSRNGMRYDLVLVYMAVIGIVGLSLDRLCFQAKFTPVAH